MTPKGDGNSSPSSHRVLTLNYYYMTPKGDGNVNSDIDLTEYLEWLAKRPELRMLFSVTKDATKADVEKAVRIIEALRNEEQKK